MMRERLSAPCQVGACSRLSSELRRACARASSRLRGRRFERVEIEPPCVPRCFLFRLRLVCATDGTLVGPRSAASVACEHGEALLDHTARGIETRQGHILGKMRQGITRDEPHDLRGDDLARVGLGELASAGDYLS